MTRPAHRCATGFTLVELLIGLAVLALLSLLGYRAMASLSDAEVRLAAEADHWRTLDLFFAQFEHDCREAVPRRTRGSRGLYPAFDAGTDAGGSAVLTFSRAGPEFVQEPGSAGQRIGYRVRGEQIEILYWPAYDVPDGVPPTTYPLVQGVRALRIAYLDGAGTWRDRWPVESGPALPRAVRVALTLADGDVIERLMALQ